MAAIPVKVDNIKRYGNFRMTRCTYLTIECDCPSPELSLSFKDQNFPFYLFGLSGLILKPLKGELFDTPELIDELIETIEERAGLFVDINDIWLPNYLFKEKYKRGDVFRIDDRLFIKAHAFRENRIPESRFQKFCKEEGAPCVSFSEAETKAFKEWALRHVAQARQRYKASNFKLKRTE